MPSLCSSAPPGRRLDRVTIGSLGLSPDRDGILQSFLFRATSGVSVSLSNGVGCPNGYVPILRPDVPGSLCNLICGTTRVHRDAAYFKFKLRLYSGADGKLKDAENIDQAVAL